MGSQSIDISDPNQFTSKPIPEYPQRTNYQSDAQYEEAEQNYFKRYPEHAIETTSSVKKYI